MCTSSSRASSVKVTSCSVAGCDRTVRASSAWSEPIRGKSNSRSAYDLAVPARPGSCGSPAPTKITGKLSCTVRWIALMIAANSSRPTNAGGGVPAPGRKGLSKASFGQTLLRLIDLTEKIKRSIYLLQLVPDKCPRRGSELGTRCRPPPKPSRIRPYRQISLDRKQPKAVAMPSDCGRSGHIVPSSS
jgi:hypothetical protein